MAASADVEQRQVVIERLSLMEEDSAAAMAELAAARRRRRVVGGSAAVLGLASGAVLWKAMTQCVPAVPLAEQGMVGLFESYPEDLGRIAEPHTDEDALHQWLSAANYASTNKDAKESVSAATREEVTQALASNDVEKAKELVEKSMLRSVERSKSKRRDLKNFVKSKRRNLKKKKSAAADTTDYKAMTASCVFDTLSATTTMAGIAANFNDATKTCWGVKVEDMFNFGNPSATHTNVCAVNVFAVLGGLVGIASTLSSAADDCATSLIPNVDALCSVAVTGLVTAVSGMGGAATLVNAACRPEGWYARIPEGMVPSNVGSNEFFFDKTPGAREKAIAEGYVDPRKLEGTQEPSALEVFANFSQSAPARKLLFGGGKGSTATHCAIEISSTMWNLAAAALAINGASHGGAGSCPPKNVLTGSTKRDSSLLFTAPEALCTVDVSATIVGFLSAVTYIELAVVNCADTINLGAICGSGIVGLFAASAGLAQASAGIWLACDVAQKPIFKKALDVATKVDKGTNGQISKLIGGGLGGDTQSVPYGRRLTEKLLGIAEENVAELKKKFDTPLDAFKSIGFDLDDKDAEFRKHEIPGVDMAKLASLVQEQEEQQQSSSLFGSRTCKA